jgi:UPF0716 protein FxsA
VLGRLFFLFTAMTLIEVYVLMSIGSLLGAELTIGIIILTAFAGSYLVRSQGVQTVQKLQARLAAGEAPGQEIVEGIMLLVCGVLLVTPGFVTDALGLLVLTPHIRGRLAKAIIAQYKDRIIPQSTFTGNAQGFSYSSTHSSSESSPFQQPPTADSQAKNDGAIEGDFVEVNRDDNKLN